MEVRHLVLGDIFCYTTNAVSVQTENDFQQLKQAEVKEREIDGVETSIAAVCL